MVRKGLIAVASLTLLALGVAIIVYVGVARDRLSSNTPTPVVDGLATLTPVMAVTSLPGVDEVLVQGTVTAYEPGGLIAVIQPMQSVVEQIIIPDDVPVIMSDGTLSSKMMIEVGQQLEAVGQLDALGRLVATRIMLVRDAVQPTPILVPTEEAQTEADTAWRSEFYVGEAVAGEPVLVRSDATLSFDWGLASPAMVVPADHFAARFERRFELAEGHYSFYAQADDGVRLWVDDVLIIDAWLGASGIVQADVLISEAVHTIRVEYREAEGQASLYVWWNNRAQYPEWQGAYYDNLDLSGSPAFVRNDPLLEFDWGESSPGVGVPADNFSVRWQRTVSLPAGAYEFSVSADDGVAVWVDGLRIIDVWPRGSGEIAYGYIWLAEGPHALRVEYFEESGGANVHLGWTRQETFSGWKGEYYSNADLAGMPVFVRNDDSVEFVWEDGSPGAGLAADNFSARWTRDVEFEDARYSFFAIADDGVRVYVDGTLLINEWRDSEAERYDGEMLLTEGTHQIVVEYYERGQDAMVMVGWGIVLTPTPSPTMTSTATATPTATQTPTATPALSATPSATPFSWGTFVVPLPTATKLFSFPTLPVETVVIPTLVFRP